MTTGPSVTINVDFKRAAHGRKKVVARPRGGPPGSAAPPGRLPRITRLLALAIRLEDLIQRGELRDYAEAARAGGVTPARISQIAGLALLSPLIQEEILFLPRVDRGRDPVSESRVRAIAAEPEWGRQERMWIACRKRHTGGIC